MIEITSSDEENVKREKRMKRIPSESGQGQTKLQSYLPKICCKEKIVLCIDVSNEADNLNFRSRSGGIYMFLQNKSRFATADEFALVLCQGDSCGWLMDFTEDIADLINCMKHYTTDFGTFDEFRFDALFDLIASKVTFPVTPDIRKLKTETPPFVVRAILIYCRSHVVPRFVNLSSRSALMDNPYFFVDVVYVHEPVANENKCEQIFSALCDLDQNDSSYVLEVSANPTKVYDCFAKLLGHPLQRAKQRDAEYDIEKLGVKEPVSAMMS